MTTFSSNLESRIQKDRAQSVSADVNFAFNKFPKYKIGADYEILDEDHAINSSSLEEILAREEIHLSEQKTRISVRDIASKFNKNLEIASKLSDEAEIIKVVSLEGHVILKKLIDALEVLRGHLTGPDKGAIKKAINMVEALAVKLTQGEGELLQEKFQMKKLATFVKQVMNMALELKELRVQVWQKSLVSSKLQKEMQSMKKNMDGALHMYKLHGCENIGSCLRIQPYSDKLVDTSTCSFRWYRTSPDYKKSQMISGANELSYSPEPLDVGQMLHAEVTCEGRKISLVTSGPMRLGVDLGRHVETLTGNHNTEFTVVVSYMNGREFPARSAAHVFHVGKTRIKVCRGWITKSRESYSSSMLLYGVRGGGKMAGKSVVWHPRKGVSFVMAFESERDRNAAIIIARKHASNLNVTLVGPGEAMWYSSSSRNNVM